LFAWNPLLQARNNGDIIKHGQAVICYAATHVQALLAITSMNVPLLTRDRILKHVLADQITFIPNLEEESAPEKRVRANGGVCCRFTPNPGRLYPNREKDNLDLNNQKARSDLSEEGVLLRMKAERLKGKLSI
ncbi:hypothetical protein THAOC_28508, partial [Thalassiosira oceanica]